MHIINLGQKTIVLGLNWHSARTQEALNKQSWLAQFEASRYAIVAGENRFSIGALKESIIKDYREYRKLYSLAGLFQGQLVAGVVLFKLETAGDSEAIYWGCVFEYGVPIFETSSTGAPSFVIDEVIKYISSPVNPRIDTKNPLLISNIEGEDEALPEFQKLLKIRSFNNDHKTYEELINLVIDGQAGLLRGLDSRLNILNAIDSLPKEKKIKAVVYSISVIALMFMFGDYFSGEKEVILPEVPVAFQPSVKVDTLSILKEDVSKSIAAALLGSNLNWVSHFVNHYKKLPSFSYGYKKGEMSCNLMAAACEVEYEQQGEYRRFDAALKQLQSILTDVQFTVNGDKFTGYIPITNDLVRIRKLQIEDLPNFDGGAVLINEFTKATRHRNSVSIRVEGVNSITVSPSDKTLIYPKDAPTTYLSFGWTAEGLDTNAGYILNNIKNDFIAVTDFTITPSNGIREVVLNGVYLSKEKK